RDRAHEICRIPHQANLLDCSGRGRDVPGQPAQLSGSARTNPLDVRRIACVFDRGDSVWAEVSGRTALDQDAGGRTFSAVGVGEADPNSGGGEVLADLHERELSWPDFIKAGAIVGFPMLLVLAQPDLGTALTYIPIAVIGLFLGGVRLKQALTVVVLAGLMMPVAFHVLKPYQRERLTSFMQPEADSQGSGYQVIQSLIAVGSGGLWGSSAGSQTHLAFLPVPQTDFIFAAFAEEHGFVGALTVLLLYFIVLMRLTQNAQTAPDRAGTFVVMGVVAVLSFHILVNVGMVVGFMPVTGIPLPLMSYGGSSVLFTFLALGIVMNVRMRRFVN